MQLSKDITKKYISRFLLFKNTQETADMIGVKRATVVRWIAGEGTPRESLLPDIERAFDKLLDWIEEQGFGEVAAVVEFERPEIKGVLRVKASYVESWLYDRLKDRKPRHCTYDRVMKDAIKQGITRSQLYRASVKLGIRKDVQGYGAERESLWSL